MLHEKNTGLIMVDIQGKLAEIMHDHPVYLDRCAILLEMAGCLSLPVITMEQLPDKLGPTHPLLQAKLDQHGLGKAYDKATFSGLQSPNIQEAIDITGCSSWLVFGIETHICVFQTARDLKNRGHHVEIPQDCVSSRKDSDKQMALARMRDMGIPTTSLEMALYDLLARADRPEFKAMLPYVK